jgi:quinol monooxygenase YgiN
MINVLASIRVKAECRDAFLEIFKANVPAVLAEDGCLGYMPTVDVASGLPPQELDACVVTIIEQWRDLAALKAHLGAAHMLAYKEQVKDLVESVTLKVLQPA